MKTLLTAAFKGGLILNAWLTRRRGLQRLESKLLTPLFVRLTRVLRRQPMHPHMLDSEALGRTWERLIGNAEYARLTSVDRASGTAYGEITGWCPLRGSGDVSACHRLMAYDRGLMAPLGAEFIVLASQAEPGRTTCKVAIRKTDLIKRSVRPASLTQTQHS